MKKIVIAVSFLMSVALVLGGCGASGPTKEQVYEDSVDLMERDMEDQGVINPDFSSMNMTTITRDEERDGFFYIVEGNVSEETEYGTNAAEYTMKILYENAEEWIEYEWITE